MCLFTYLLYTYGHFVCMHIYAPHVSLIPMEPEDSFESPRTTVRNLCEQRMDSGKPSQGLWERSRCSWPVSLLSSPWFWCHCYFGTLSHTLSWPWTLSPVSLPQVLELQHAPIKWTRLWSLAPFHTNAGNIRHLDTLHPNLRRHESLPFLNHITFKIIISEGTQNRSQHDA